MAEAIDGISEKSIKMRISGPFRMIEVVSKAEAFTKSLKIDNQCFISLEVAVY